MGGGGKGGVHIQPHPPVGVPPPPVVFARAGRLADTRRPRGDPAATGDPGSSPLHANHYNYAAL